MRAMGAMAADGRPRERRRARRRPLPRRASSSTWAAPGRWPCARQPKRARWRAPRDRSRSERRACASRRRRAAAGARQHVRRSAGRRRRASRRVPLRSRRACARSACAASPRRRAELDATVRAVGRVAWDETRAARRHDARRRLRRRGRGRRARRARHAGAAALPLLQPGALRGAARVPRSAARAVGGARHQRARARRRDGRRGRATAAALGRRRRRDRGDRAARRAAGIPARSARRSPATSSRRRSSRAARSRWASASTASRRSTASGSRRRSTRRSSRACASACRRTSRCPYLPGQRFEAKVAYVYPSLQADRRTARVRLVLAESRTARCAPTCTRRCCCARRSARGSRVPDTAVLRAGDRSFVFLDLGDGRLRPQRVETGIESDGRIEITSGLDAGPAASSSRAPSSSRARAGCARRWSRW